MSILGEHWGYFKFFSLINNAAMIAQVILPKHNLRGKKKTKHNLEFISPIFKNSPPFSCMQKSILNIVVIKNPSETLMTAISLLSENSSWTTELHIKFRDSWKPHHGPNNAIKTSPGCVMCPWLWTGHSELSALLPAPLPSPLLPGFRAMGTLLNLTKPQFSHL